MAALAPYLADPPLHLDYLPGRSGLLVLAFTGVGGRTETVPTPEAIRLTGWDGENHVLFIGDASRSWMNAPGFVEKLSAAVDELVEKIRPTRIVAFGNSMGGSSAMIWASLHKVDAVLAIVPQHTVNPELLPEERRWRHFRQNIATWRYPAVPDISGRGIEVMILHGGDSGEFRHARRFVRGRGVDHYILPGYGHSVARSMKSTGHLAPLMTNFLAGNMQEARRVVESAGGVTFAAYRQELRAARKARRLARAAAAADQNAIES